jgi:hypothetical protein
LISLPQKRAVGASLTEYLKKICYGLCFLLIVILGWACAQSEIRNTAPAPKVEDFKTEVRLRERAQAYWAARKEDDVETQYSLEEVSLTKKVSLVEFIRKKPVADILEFELGNVQMDTATGKATIPVKVTAVFKLSGFSKKPLITTLNDSWTFLEGDWYHTL